MKLNPALHTKTHIIYQPQQSVKLLSLCLMSCKLFADPGPATVQLQRGQFISVTHVTSGELQVLEMLSTPNVLLDLNSLKLTKLIFTCRSMLTSLTRAENNKLKDVPFVFREVAAKTFCLS